MKTFWLNLGIKLGDSWYRIALMNPAYKSIDNTPCWNRGWKQLFWKIYTNKIKI